MTMYLYRKARRSVTLAAGIVVFSFALQAQFSAPQPERKTPRAIGVLETFKNGSRRLVPVTFFYERHYYDATFYHATPVPFTLHSETVYEVQHFGKTLGTFTVQSATQNAAAWFGNGRYKADPDEAMLAKKKALRPVMIEDPSKPVLHRRAGSEGDNPVAHPATASTAPGVSDDPDRPKLHRRDDSGTGKSGPAASTDSNVTQHPATTAELTPSDDPDHPILRRGKPVREQSGHDLTDIMKNEEPVTRQVAISDAGPSEPQQLIYVCPEEERNHLEASARELAQNELRRVAAQRGIAMPVVTAEVYTPPAKAVPPAKQKIAPAAPLELKLDEAQFVPYDLGYNNYATVVFSARYVPEAASAQGTAASNLTGKSGGVTGTVGPRAVPNGKGWIVTVVARQDGVKLIKLYSAVSDPRELDLYPEVRLVDAVDPDGSGRYGLLFRVQKRDGVSWLLTRATGYELQTVHETAAR